MIIDHDTYAVFEANQVLTEAHLNELFAYLDEQERLTRANLIGIGIACGLEIERDEDAGAIRLSKGCGVTSQGYLIVEPRDVTLVSWRSYVLPDRLGYPTFDDSISLWELFPAGEPGTQPLGSGGLSLEDKVVVLFLELKQEDLRTCTSNDCDDRGAAVTATVRRLLVATPDLDAVIAAADRLDDGLAPQTVEADLLARLQLPDLRLPRVDVPNSGPVTSEDVLAAFQRPFSADRLAERAGTALSRAYQAFRPLVATVYQTDPFADFAARFGFLDAAPTTSAEVRFLPYYWDLFDDLVRAYDEFRWAGADLMCACCPPDGLFPRHLMLGAVTPASVPEPGAYRHRFLPSPAVSDCEARTRDVLLLFRRLVGVVQSFTNDPPLPRPRKGAVDPQIRITPSAWGSGPLGATAIPYYYRQDGAPPLYQVWNPERTRRRRADQNLGYRADEYGPNTPAFVTEPLRYELEPHNFLRIEGHLGKNVRTAMSTLLTHTTRSRLPIEVVALRTGAFDQNAPVDLTAADCRFEDLEALYATLKAELTCFLCAEVRYFYDLQHEGSSPVTDPQPPALALLRECAPGYLVQPGTLGRLIEDALGRQRAIVLRRAVVISPRNVFAIHALALVNGLEQLWARLSQDVRHLDLDGVDDAHTELIEVAAEFERARVVAVESGAPGHFGAAGLDARLSDILFRCRLDPFRALHAEYERRFREVQQAQFLSSFLQKHPGIQHKSGVPLGGTFIVVYHESASTVVRRPDLDRTVAVEAVDEGRPAVRELVAERSRVVPSGAGEGDDALSKALARLEYSRELAANPDVQNVFQLLTGKVLIGRRPPGDGGTRIYVDTVAELPDGTVIADFFLPYICCSDCAPIHFTIAKDRPRLDLRVGCTNVNGNAEVAILAQGTAGAVSVQVDGGPFEASTGTLLLPVGAHTVVIRDDDGAESAPTPVAVPPALRIGDERTIDDAAAGTYQVTFEVSGGTAPYAAEPAGLAGSTYTSPAVPSGQGLTVTITDAAGCTAEETFRHVVEPLCDLPCEGEAIRTGYRFWLPVPRTRLPLVEYRADPVSLLIAEPGGATFDLGDRVAAIVNPQNPLPTSSAKFTEAMAEWMKQINAVIESAVGSDDWVRLVYEPPARGSTIGTLRIDRLGCLDLVFTLGVTFSQGQKATRLELEYSTKGTSLRGTEIDDDGVFIPAFDPVRSNKCRPEEPPVEVCAEVRTRLEIQREGGAPDRVVLTAVPVDGEPPVAFLWEVQDARPALADGESVAFLFDPLEPTQKFVRLTAFTRDGCRSVLEQQIEIRG